MKFKDHLKDFILPGVAFLLIFTMLLTSLTLIYLPKWGYTDDHGQMSGLYREPSNTIDVLFLGSCNMYSSISPVLMYEEYGVTGYAMACPDQELSTSYYFLKEALKTQSPKVVVVEALFFTQENSSKREYYNRFALDYMPLSLNKLSMAYELASRESEFMQERDATAPDALLTFFSYIFPILRYHSRTDLTEEDLTFFTEDNLSNPNKGNAVNYKLQLNDDYFSDVVKVFNGNGINDVTKEYFPKIKALCDENNIELVVMKSPNYCRWGTDAEPTRYVREYVEKFGVPFIDMLSEPYNNFIPEDYGAESTLNVYGDKKLTHTLATYLVDQYQLQPTKLTAEQTADWNACVASYYAVAEEKGFNLTPGELMYITNLDGASSVRWNECDSRFYDVYRSEGHSKDFKKVATVSGGVYDDKNVKNGSGYSYYVVPTSGSRAGVASGVQYNIYVDMPKNLVVINEDGALTVNWSSVEGDNVKYRIHRMVATGYSYEAYSTLSISKWTNTKVVNGRQYTYRVTAFIEENGVKYYSEAAYASGVPQKTPVITSISVSEDGAVTLTWDKMDNQTRIEVWRTNSTGDGFELYTELSGSKTKYTNSVNLRPGVEYFYKIVAVVERYGVVSRSAESNVVSIVAVGTEK